LVKRLAGIAVGGRHSICERSWPFVEGASRSSAAVGPRTNGGMSSPSDRSEWVRRSSRDGARWAASARIGGGGVGGLINDHPRRTCPGARPADPSPRSDCTRTNTMAPLAWTLGHSTAAQPKEPSRQHWAEGWQAPRRRAGAPWDSDSPRAAGRRDAGQVPWRWPGGMALEQAHQLVHKASWVLRGGATAQVAQGAMRARPARVAGQQARGTSLGIQADVSPGLPGSLAQACSLGPRLEELLVEAWGWGLVGYGKPAFLNCCSCCGSPARNGTGIVARMLSDPG